MPGIALVADKNTVACFKLAGLKDVYSVENAEDAEKHLHALLEKKDIAIVLVAERIMDQIHDTIEKIVERKYPVIIPISDMKGTIALKTDLIVELIRNKTGIEVKLR
jgi:V/A-type H+-transporting ATPase subunit F